MNCKERLNTLRVTRGNVFRITTTLTEKIKQEGVMTDVPIDIASITSVKLIPKFGDASTFSTYTRDGAVFVFTFPSTLTQGDYTIEVIGTRDNENSDPFRWQKSKLFSIVDYTDQSYTPTDIVLEFEVDGSIGISSGGSRGGGSGEANVIEMVKVNGTALTPDANKAVDIPVPTNTDQLTNGAGFLTAHQDISGKEDTVTIATALETGSKAAFGKYYRLSISSALTVNLPQVSTSETKLKGFMIYLTIETNGSVQFAANNNEYIKDSGVSTMAEGKTYEVNAVWNGAVWAITANEFTAYSTT